MKKITLRALAAALTATAALAGCGGGGSAENNSAPNYAAMLAQLNTPAGLTSPAVANAFDDAYLDSGMTKPQVLDALAAEASALSGHGDHSLFPQVALENVQLVNCDGNKVCTLTGTLRNGDAEDTSVPVTIKVVSTGFGNFRLLGDQLAS